MAPSKPRRAKGRKKATAEKQRHMFSVYLTEVEKQLIEEMATTVYLPTAVYIRVAALEKANAAKSKK